MHPSDVILYDNSVQVYPKKQLLQRATVNSGSGTTLGGSRLEGEGFVQMFLLPCCYLTHS